MRKVNKKKPSGAGSVQQLLINDFIKYMVALKGKDLNPTQQLAVDQVFGAMDLNGPLEVDLSKLPSKVANTLLGCIRHSGNGVGVNADTMEQLAIISDDVTEHVFRD